MCCINTAAAALNDDVRSSQGSNLIFGSVQIVENSTDIKLFETYLIVRIAKIHLFLNVKVNVVDHNRPSYRLTPTLLMTLVHNFF